LVALTLVALAAGAAVALTDGGPSVFGDETLYVQNAHAIAHLTPLAVDHFPPFYPLLLALGHLTENWHTAMLLVNAAVSAMTVPAMWFLARTLRLPHSWVPVALVALMPFQGVYSGYLLAENAGVPLLLLCVTIAIRGKSREATLLGLALAALHLTKYLYAPAVVLLLIIWTLRLGKVVDPAQGDLEER